MHLPGKAGGRDRGRGWVGLRLIERGLGAAVEITAVCLFICGVANTFWKRYTRYVCDGLI